jgi:hypothetical protein
MVADLMDMENRQNNGGGEVWERRTGSGVI